MGTQLIASTMQLLVFICFHVFLGASSTTHGFLKHKLAPRFNLANLEFKEAFATVMGCGSDRNVASNFTDVEMALLPMWNAAPKDANGRMEWRMVRYLAHRYFLRTSSLFIRGLEPGRKLSASHAGTADIMNERVPRMTDVLAFGSFSLDDLVSLVAALEQVIFDSESSLLEAVYEEHDQRTDASLSEIETVKILESYIVHWLLGAENEGAIQHYMAHPDLRENHLPQWTSIKHFIKGLVKSMEFARARSPVVGRGANIISSSYSFEDVHKAVATITWTFGSFWQSECDDVTTSLTALDRTGTGRVPLSEFYAAHAAGEWRFSESEQYLREVGALDESLGSKQLIISNYVLGPNNCFAHNSHYYLCCNNACEAVLNEIEDLIGSPFALPQDILLPLANITSYDDQALKLTPTLATQLERIAYMHGGKVPLHGRLFAQWLHYVLPTDCPFPHKSGTTTKKLPAEYGRDYKVADSVVDAHVSKQNRTDAGALIEEFDETQWMTQWSEDEELIVNYSEELRAPWYSTHPGQYASRAVLALLALLLLGAGAVSKGDNMRDALPNLPATHLVEVKAHFV